MRWVTICLTFGDLLSLNRYHLASALMPFSLSSPADFDDSSKFVCYTFFRGCESLSHVSSLISPRCWSDLALRGSAHVDWPRSGFQVLVKSLMTFASVGVRVFVRPAFIIEVLYWDSQSNLWWMLSLVVFGGSLLLSWAIKGKPQREEQTSWMLQTSKDQRETSIFKLHNLKLEDR